MIWILLALTLPNVTLTPGLAREDLTVEQICNVKWGHDQRMVTETMRREVFHAYGIPYAKHRDYELDHLIPRELGGADNIANLWPQIWSEAHQKDKEENRLHRAVCAGEIGLETAQRQMRTWGR